MGCCFLKKIFVLLLTVLAITVCVGAVDVSNVSLTVNSPNAENYGGDIVVSGSFNAGSSLEGKAYYVYLARLDSSRKFESAEVSQKFVIKEGANSFSASFPSKTEKQMVRAFLLTENLTPLYKRVQTTVTTPYLEWDVTDEAFYNYILSSSVTNNTDLSKAFLADEEVTVAEGVAMTSVLHAKYNNADVNAAINNEFKLDFDGDEKEICTLSYHNASGSVSDGIIVYQPTESFDHGLKIEGIELDAKKYNKLTVRMKRDFLANNSSDTKNRTEELEIFYKTNLDPKYTGSKVVYARIPKEIDMSNWFEFTIELNDAEYTDLITGIRFDSTNNNGVYYVDYISLSKSDDEDYENWYDKYVDYAVANGIIDNNTFGINSYDRPITREELYALFVSAIPESHFNAKNSIKGIPDVKKDDWNADVFLMLYNAGITLGDKSGNFNGKMSVNRSEACMVFNRILVSSNRLSGKVSADWTSDASSYDQEFDETYIFSFLCPYKVDNASTSVSGGKLIINATKSDPQFYLKNNTNLNADVYKKAIVRLKPEVSGNPENLDWDFFFKTSEDTSSFNEQRSLHNKYSTYSYVDAAGWWIIEIDLRLQKYWRGTAKNFRFDPANSIGKYTLDYIRFVKYEEAPAEHDKLIEAGYTATEFIKDDGFENGFYVCQFEQKNNYDHGMFTYNETGSVPLWQIDPWWCTYDLWENRDTTTDKYTLKDTHGVNTLVYNPELKSVSMRLNATNIYKGQPHDDNYRYWPHLLLEQCTNICPVDRENNSVDVDKLVAEVDVRLTDFKNTTNTQGENSCLYLIYFYLKTEKAPGHKIWFGLTLFENDADKTCGVDWNFDPYSDMMIYRMTTVSTFGDLSKSFTPSAGTYAPSNEWKTLRVDLMPEIRRAVEWANRDNIFGTQVSLEDMYIDGVNVGYETRGNFDATVEIKNLNLISYDKD